MAGGRARVEGTLSLAQRQTLAGVLLEPAMMGHETVTVLVATEMTAVSLVRALEGASAKLLTLPVTVAAGAAA